MGLPRTARYWFLLAGSLSWLLLILLPAWLQAAGWPEGRALQWLFAPVCHQLPERSFSWGAAPLAVCHRCFGVYGGFALGLLCWPHLPRLAGRFQRRSRLLWLFLLPIAIDVLLANQPWDRVLTGALAGFPTALFVWLAVEQLGRSSVRPAPQTALASPFPSRLEVDGPLQGSAVSQRSHP